MAGAEIPFSGSMPPTMSSGGSYSSARPPLLHQPSSGSQGPGQSAAVSFRKAASASAVAAANAAANASQENRYQHSDAYWSDDEVCCSVVNILKIPHPLTYLI